MHQNYRFIFFCKAKIAGINTAITKQTSPAPPPPSPPWPADPRSQGQVPSGPFSFNDATIFTDGTGFVVGSGNPALAAGAPRGALSIQTQGWYPNVLAIGAGDMIGLAGRLYIATEAITASGTGTATIPIAPPLREALLVNQPLVLTKPSVPMRLVSDDEAANPTRPGGFTAITIRLEEAL